MFHLNLNNMNKNELVTAMSEAAGISKADADKALGAFCDGVESALSKGDKVSLVGFGTFSVSARAARTGRNPQTGKPIKIAAKKVAKFKAGKKLTDSLN